MTTRSTTDALPQDTHLGRTALRVTDLDELTRFYQQVVGLAVLDRSSTHATLGVEDRPLLVLEADEDALERHTASAGLFHNAFRVPSREALGDALGRIRAHWQLAGASDHGVSEALYLTDPEGNGIEIYRDYPPKLWPSGGDGAVRMTTSPLDLQAVANAGAGHSTVPSGTDVGHIHLEVSSLEVFRDFYVDDIGFEVQTRLPGALFVAAGGYHHHIGANTWNHRSSPVSGRGLSWFEVVLPDTDTLHAIRSRIEDSQYTITERPERTERAGRTHDISIIGPDEIEVRFTDGSYES